MSETIKQSKTIQIKRSQISMAGYNPRKITPEARKKLEANLETMGLMGGIVWNKNTSNLVSGHQRLSILDKKMKYNKTTKENDYDVYVVEVELTEKEEKEQNIFFNNQSAMGFFDDDKLKEVMRSVDFSEATGFSKQNQVSYFAESNLTDEDYREIAQRVSEHTKDFKEISTVSENDSNYVVLVFKNRGEKESLIDNLGFPLDDGRFCNGNEFLSHIYSHLDDFIQE